MEMIDFLANLSAALITMQYSINCSASLYHNALWPCCPRIKCQRVLRNWSNASINLGSNMASCCKRKRLWISFHSKKQTCLIRNITCIKQFFVSDTFPPSPSEQIDRPFELHSFYLHCGSRYVNNSRPTPSKRRRLSSMEATPDGHSRSRFALTDWQVVPVRLAELGLKYTCL